MSFQQCGKCKEIYDNVVPHSCKVDPAIAAHDKWWIDKIDAMFIITLSSGEEIRQPHIVITHTEWQQLKKELEVK